MNFIHSIWPTLIKRNNFIQSLSTPIIKVTKGKEIIEFYNNTDFETWETQTENSHTFQENVVVTF